MSLKQKIEDDIKAAMLAKKKEELMPLRAIKSAILLAGTEKGAEGELTEEAELKLLTKAAKQRKDSADVFTQNGRNDLAEKELFEFEIIARYLPKQMSDEEVNAAIAGIISEVGASSMQDMGKVMGKASKLLAGKADGKKIADTVKSLLA
ncbi:MAG: GatB/YqeY domain-containing protein [Cyclobacteriaceae bacterium]|nr:GatB/YqeY domain-containing protein [Cyclobacteriaceae bacterium]